MPANECISWFEPGQNVTGRVTGAPVTGMTCVSYVSGGLARQPDIATAVAGAVIAGVAAHDQIVGEHVAVKSEGVVPITASGDITANDPVSVGAGGTVVPATAAVPSDGTTAGTAGSVVIGRAVADAASGSEAAIHLSL